MHDPAKQLKEMPVESEFFIGIDSDGCVFDTMGIKQRECFCPMMIAYFSLQPVAKAARQCKEFADLFSKTRGANRHKTIVRILTELLPNHPEVKEIGFKVPRFEHYCDWVNNPNSLLSNDGLQKEIKETKNPQAKAQLQHALKWSLRVNEMVTEIVKDIPPFPYVRQILEKISKHADVIVCSATPNEALLREWLEHDIARFAKVIAGQEMGTKTQHLTYASAGKYKPNHVLVIGDAPGDFNAAKANDALFYPINPGDEPRSWKRFHDEAFDIFINGRYAGVYQEKLLAEFDSYLPEDPDW